MRTFLVAVDLSLATIFAVNAGLVWFGGFIPQPWLVGILYVALSVSCVSAAIGMMSE